jgi:hypothetical protein
VRKLKVEGFILTLHSIRRAALRNFSRQEIEYILRYASVFETYRSDIYVLFEKDIPQKDRKTEKIRKLSGSVIIVNSRKEMVITMYQIYCSRELARWLREIHAHKIY